MGSAGGKEKKSAKTCYLDGAPKRGRRDAKGEKSPSRIQGTLAEQFSENIPTASKKTNSVEGPAEGVVPVCPGFGYETVRGRKT